MEVEKKVEVLHAPEDSKPLGAATMACMQTDPALLQVIAEFKKLLKCSKLEVEYELTCYILKYKGH